MQVKRRDVAICAACGALSLLLIGGTATFVGTRGSFGADQTVVVGQLPQASAYFRQPTALPKLTTVDATKETFMTEENWAVISDWYETGEDYEAGVQINMFKSGDITAEGANAALYELANAFFNVYYGDTRVSPILPLALANVETPGRADNNITWSALFPSRYVPVEDMYTFDVTSVVSNPEYYKVFSADYSTRDRGPLQMSPTYGTGDPACTALMSPSEKEKLAKVDTSKYSSWVSGAASTPGDRFCISDICLRLTAAFKGQVSYMAKNNFVPTSDLHLVAMLAMSHQSSGVWYHSNHSKAVGCWKSGELAYEWSRLAASPQVIKILEEEATNSDACYITSNKATELLSKAGIGSYSNYATKSIVCTYPVKVLYSYIKLCMLYTQ